MLDKNGLKKYKKSHCSTWNTRQFARKKAKTHLTKRREEKCEQTEASTTSYLFTPSRYDQNRSSLCP